ncbi:MAG: Peptidase [Verrucomicrobiales bacterium]|nr:Peptidase [Verrucomicrobiales bacterium]
MTESEQLLLDLIAIPSVNPAFLDDPTLTHEQRVADYLFGIARRAKLDVELVEVKPRRPNLIAKLAPSGKVNQRILMAPHFDTVGLVDPSQLKPRRSAGRIQGRGACDTKGSVASMFSALLTMAKAKRLKNTELVFVGLIDEENTQLGSRFFVSKKERADLAIVGEPTELKVITAHKGDIWLEFSTQGKAAHGAKPHLGKNAVHEMARIVHLLETLYQDTLAQRSHPLLGSPTINVGAIRGGTQANIVPDKCTMIADRRTIPGENLKSVRKELATLLRNHGLKAEITDQKMANCDPMETDCNNTFVRSFLDAMAQKKGLGADYFCDAAILAGGGIPSVVFGPGSINQAHTVDEWISIRSLNDATASLVRFFSGLP